jgi:hypothetical protein
MKKIYRLGTEYFVDHRTLSVVKTADFISDRVSYTVPSGSGVISNLLTLLFPWSRVLLEELTAIQLIINIPHFMELERS